MTRLLAALACAVLASASLVQAETPQSFTAQVGDIAFESADADINLIPISGNFSLSASTRGASDWPPPKTRIDRLAIVCDGFGDGRTLRLDHRAFERSVCSATFYKGVKPMGGEPETSYQIDKDSSENRFEITAANGKVYEGTFSFRLKNDKGESIAVTNGRFKAEDRQL